MLTCKLTSPELRNGKEQVIAALRLCCDFFDFTLSLKNETVWLGITGPEGTKDFIKTELELG